MPKCVVTTRSNDLPGVLVHCHTGAVAKPTAGALAGVIEELIANHRQRETMIYCGRALTALFLFSGAPRSVSGHG